MTVYCLFNTNGNFISYTHDVDLHIDIVGGGGTWKQISTMRGQPYIT